MQPQQNPYGFITSDQQQNKPSLAPGGLLKNKLLLIVIGLGVLLVIILLLAMTLSGGDSGKDALRSVQQRQVELARITGLNQISQNGSRSVKSVASNINLTVTSDKNKLNAAMAKRKISFRDKDLAIATSGATTQKIETALAAGTLTPTFVDVVKSELISYRESLGYAYDQTQSKDIKAALQSSYANTELLIQQLESIQ